MADIDYQSSTVGGFHVSFTDNPYKATGNKALANRFEVTFLTNTQIYLLGGKVVEDNFGGNAGRYIGVPQALNNPESIAASLTVAIDKTTESILATQNESTPLTERLISAELINMEVLDGVVYAKVKLVPEEYEGNTNLFYNIPIREA